jgi:NTP pyrophosphatase (non-canonical NTP hydrolase)
MNLREYQMKARETAIYLKVKDSKILYPTLGLVGECGEVAGKMKKLIRDDKWIMKPDRMTAIIKELGDCCWYLANICCDTNLELNTIYEKINSSVAYKINRLSILRQVLHMNRHANIIAEFLENWHYDHQCNLNKTNNFKNLPIHIYNVLICIEEIAYNCHSNLREVYTLNIEKLTKRKQDGTLTGDGDNR